MSRAHPEGVARRRMGIVGQCIEKQIGKLDPREMLRQVQRRGEYQPFRIDAARDAWARLLGFFAERLGQA